MKIMNIFAALPAAALLAVTLLGGCSDHSGSYGEKPIKETVTTTEGIVVWTTSAHSGDVTTAKAGTTTKKTTANSASSKKNTTSRTTTVKKNKKTTTSEESEKTTTTTTVFDSGDGSYVEYHFRSEKQLTMHFEKHGAEFEGDFDYKTAAEYEKGASDVINNSKALHKTEAEDGDSVYYIEATNEFVILSTDGYIRTYFRPNGGKRYYDRQ
ncbi:hypothetical protein [Ruminococcus sp.]|uniref:hypothetical protein n=1 Tax=Ruminococcus sp. TaxID=41978 RepID=UPI001B5CDF70|nr:hypothetical protein [Ruminococcus sp.]MBP5431203.1 hypothetical protein [Ruminococcus sp.]